MNDRRNSTKPDFDLMVYRFTADAPAMTKFFDALGLQRMTGGNDNVTYHGVTGGLTLQSASGSASGFEAGQTQLAFDVTDIDPAADRLRDAGLDPRIWEEPYGRAMSVRDPSGLGVWINEIQYETDSAHSDSRLDVSVVAVRASENFDDDTAFYSLFGYEPRPLPMGYGSQGYHELLGPRTSGSIGLHNLDSPDLATTTSHPGKEPIGYAAACRLAFTAAEQPEEIADRLHTAGFRDAQAIPGASAPRVEVTDPDGCHVEIHAV